MGFIVDAQACIGCGKCIADCPARILTLEAGKAHLAPKRAEECIECQHCLAICPTGAVSVCGIQPKECLSFAGTLPRADQVEALIKSRRSVRHYRKENLPPEVLSRLIEVASYAPTGVNSRQVLFTVVDDVKVMDRLRQDAMAALAGVIKAGKLPAQMGFFAQLSEAWEKSGVDTVFRGAPHLLIASAPKDSPCPEQDCLIALTTFELFAQTLEVGTCWDGIAKWAFTALIPEFLPRLGIPATHQFGYALVFGRPAVTYPRAVKRAPFTVNRVTSPSA